MRLAALELSLYNFSKTVNRSHFSVGVKDAEEYDDDQLEIAGEDWRQVNDLTPENLHQNVADV